MRNWRYNGDILWDMCERLIEYWLRPSGHLTRQLKFSHRTLGDLPIENDTRWCPPVISWFINPINYRYISTINHSFWSYVHQLS